MLDVDSSICNDITHKTLDFVTVLTHSSIYVSLLPFADAYWRNVELIRMHSIIPLCHGEYPRDYNQGVICFRKSDISSYCVWIVIIPIPIVKPQVIVHKVNAELLNRTYLFVCL